MSRKKKNILVYSFTGMMLLTMITFSGVKNHSRKVEEISIEIEQENGNFFTDQLEVMDLMTLNKADYLVGLELTEINPKILEQRVEKNPFVKDAQVYRDLKGNLSVNVIQSQPIARVFQEGKEDKYIDTEGNVLPINAKHTARVPLLETAFEFSWEKNLNETAYGSELLRLIEYIESNEFWNAQIAQIIVSKTGEIELLPQVTKQKVVFGPPREIEKKFRKLMTFYKEILPKKGWNTYRQVNLKYENQIICE